MSSEKKQYGKTDIIIAGLIIAYAVFVLARIVLAVVQTVNYPNEYREAANIAMTRSMLFGENIYSLKVFARKVPTVCYLYGPLMSVLALPLYFVFGMPPLQVLHYFISFVSIVVSALLMTLMVKRFTTSLSAPAAAFILTIFCHWRYGYAYGAPDSLGLCLMLGVLYLLLMGVTEEKEWKDKQMESRLLNRDGETENKKLRRIPAEGNIEMAAILTLATFFTKQYFLMVAAVGGIYLLIMSRRLFLRYAASGIAFSVLVFSLLYKFCPLYLTYAIYFLKGPGPGAAMGKTGKAHSTLQVSYLGGMFIMLFVMVLALVIYLAYTVYRNVREKGVRSACEIQDLPFLLLFFLQAGISALVLCYIGRNDGAFLSYYLQLFTPALAALSVYAVDLSMRKLQDRAPWLFAVIFVLFMGYTVYKVEPRLIINTLDKEELAQWEEAYDILDACHEKGEIYYCPPLNYYGYQANDFIYNDGQPFVFTQKFLDSYNSSETARKLFPYAGRIIERHLTFREFLRKRVAEGHYSLVTRIPDMDVVFEDDELEQNYSLYKTLHLRSGSWTWDVEFWTHR